MKLICTLILFSFYAHAEFPYIIPDKLEEFESFSSFEVTDMPPVKSQDGIGLCYSFSTTAILENYRCRELKVDCTLTSNHLSPLDVSSYETKKTLLTPAKIKEGGNAVKIFANISRSRPNIVKEECANYTSLIRRVGKFQPYTPWEKDGWTYLINKWNEFDKTRFEKKDKDCVSCLADEVKSKMENLKTSMAQIENAFKTSNEMEEFLYKTLLPTECFEVKNTLSIPEFELNTFPFYDDKHPISLPEKIESILLSNTPVEMSLCTKEVVNGECPEGTAHSLVLTGIKEICKPNGLECIKLVKVQNSYGKRWQDNHNDGWVDLKTLTKASSDAIKLMQISWISKKGAEFPSKKLIKKQPITSEVIIEQSKVKIIPEKYKLYKGVWKCPGGQYKDVYDTGCTPFSKFP